MFIIIMNLEEADSKPLLLIEVVEDPGDKNMPYKLKINKAVVQALMPSADRFVTPVLPRLLL